jgi:hypothetical protein
MTALAPQRRGRRARARDRSIGPVVDGLSAPVATAVTSLFDDVGGEPTLDELVSGVWEGLVAHQRVPCPVCGGEMAPVYAAHAQPSAGRCADCGTTLD